MHCFSVSRFISKVSTVYWSKQRALQCQSQWDTWKGFNTVMWKYSRLSSRQIISNKTQINL